MNHRFFLYLIFRQLTAFSKQSPTALFPFFFMHFRTFRGNCFEIVTIKQEQLMRENNTRDKNTWPEVTRRLKRSLYLLSMCRHIRDQINRQRNESSSSLVPTPCNQTPKKGTEREKLKAGINARCRALFFSVHKVRRRRSPLTVVNEISVLSSYSRQMSKSRSCLTGAPLWTRS